MRDSDTSARTDQPNQLNSLVHLNVILTKIIIEMILACLKRSICKFSSVVSQSESSRPYNPNISLISNIGQSNNIKQLLSLHHLMPLKFTSRHLAHAARKFTQLIKGHHSNRALRTTPLISPSDSQIFKKFITAVRSTELATISIEQYISFAVFLQKIIKFKNHLKEGESDIALIQTEFREKILRQLDQAIGQEMSFQQTYSLLNALWQILQPHQEEKILDFILAQLLKKPYCTCFHLALLSKQLQVKAGQSRVVQEIQSLCYEQTMEQLQTVQNYLHPRALIQVYNAFFPLRSQQLTFLLPIILKKMQDNPRDTTTFATFFEGHLIEFKANISQLNGQEKLIQQLQLLLEAGSKIHSSKIARQYKKEGSQEKSCSFFKKKAQG